MIGLNSAAAGDVKESGGRKKAEIRGQKSEVEGQLLAMGQLTSQYFYGESGSVNLKFLRSDL
jgi:hypothetical protein